MFWLHIVEINIKQMCIGIDEINTLQGRFITAKTALYACLLQINFKVNAGKCKDF